MAARRSSPAVKYEELVAEARSLARPCVRLSVVARRTGPVGRWGGPASPDLPLKGAHFLSFDLRALPDDFAGLELSGCASLHIEPGALESQLAFSPRVPDWSAHPRARRRRRTLKSPFTGEILGRHVLFDDLQTRCAHLYAHPDLSLPSLDDLALHGSSRVRRYLAAEGKSLEDWMCGRLAPESPVRAYLQAWHQHIFGSPEEREDFDPTLGRAGTAAVLGGWPIPIAFSYEPHRIEGRLLVSTFAQSEPWRQVWLRPDGSFVVRDLIT